MDNDMTASVAQLDYSNNKCYASAFRDIYIYIYIYIYIDRSPLTGIISITVLILFVTGFIKIFIKF